MKRIFKYEIYYSPGGTFNTTLPKGARILSVGVQAGVPVIWALVDTDAPAEPVQFLTLWTGKDASVLKDTDEFIGTFTQKGLVYHLWKISL